MRPCERMGKGFCLLEEGHPEKCVVVLEPRRKGRDSNCGCGPSLALQKLKGEEEAAAPPPSSRVDVVYEGRPGAFRATVLSETADLFLVRYDAKLRPGSAPRRGDCVWEHKSACLSVA